jgi:tRNA (adenine57-N1/adenine58-N1)-methyltransferase
MADSDGITLTYGDTLMFVGRDRKTFVRTLSPGGRLQTHYGVIEYDDLVGTSAGTRIKTHLGKDMWMVTPNLDDLITHMQRESQIIYPKDLGYILMKLGIKPGVRVIEAGTGSGGLTTVLATMIGPDGHVYSYDRRRKMQQLARRNLQRLGLAERVTFTNRDIAEGFDEEQAHALFLDVPDPWEYLEQAHAALRGGGFLGCIIPTLNQVVTLNKALHNSRWFFVQAEELLLREYRTVPNRVRPDDQMVGHTGFLSFARALIPAADEDESLYTDEFRRRGTPPPEASADQPDQAE